MRAVEYPRKFVIGSQSGWRLYGTTTAVLLAAYSLARQIPQFDSRVVFLAVSLLGVALLERTARTRASLSTETLRVRPYGFLGAESQYRLSDIQDIKNGTVNGELALQFTYRGQIVRLGPWWGFRRRSLLRSVRSLEAALTGVAGA